MKMYFIFLFLFYSSFSDARLAAKPILPCSADLVLMNFNGHIKKTNVLRFDGNTVSLLTRKQLIQHRLPSILKENAANLCGKNLSDDREELGSILLNQGNITSRYIGTVYFPRGSDGLSNGAISSCCSFIKKMPNYDGILIVGSTDSTGEASRNKNLSYMRGLVVAKSLDQNQPISIISLGSTLLQGRNNVDDPHYRRADIYTYQIK